VVIEELALITEGADGEYKNLIGKKYRNSYMLIK